MSSAIATIEVLNYYAKKLQRLRVDRAHGVAPHKPFLSLLIKNRTFVRSAAFRRIVVSLYEQKCAFCHLKIISSDNQNIVDGAHIKPFSEFRDDRFENGLALCKNHHWAFDHGWFGISDDYRIIVPSDRITEEPPDDARTMQEFNNEIIYLPQREDYYPSMEALQWHREFWRIA